MKNHLTRQVNLSTITLSKTAKREIKNLIPQATKVKLVTTVYRTKHYIIQDENGINLGNVTVRGGMDNPAVLSIVNNPYE